MKFFLGIIVGAVALALGAIVYFAGGFAPVATAAPQMPFERQLAGMALHARLNRETPKTVPIAATEPNYIAGAHGYMENCAVCHGTPGKPKTAIAAGEFPVPPQLFSGHGVTDDPPGETYWKIANGIRLTGMPGFKATLSETEMWQISLFLADGDKLPASALTVLTSPIPPPAPPVVAPAIAPSPAAMPTLAPQGQTTP